MNLIDTPLLAAALATGAITVAAWPLHPRRVRVASGRTPPAPHGEERSIVARRRVRRALRRPPTARAVADWCDDLARTLRSGSTLRDALETTLPADDATRHATDTMRMQLERGRPVADTVTRSGSIGAHLSLAFGVIGVAARLGGAPAAAIDRTAMTLRRRAADSDERRSQAAQARLSAQVLTAVPVSMLALLLATDDDVRTVIARPVGAGCVVAGLVLNGLGALWMRRIVGATP